MRKRYKKKKHSCSLCKPHKTGGAKRWKIKDLTGFREFEQLKRSVINTNRQSF